MDQITLSGSARKSLYNSWKGMIHACTNPRYHMYYLYGARGIKVSESWLHSFDQFVLDMGLRPSSAYVLDRKDKNGDFTKDNCRWSTRKEQARNTRRSVRVEFMGLKDQDGKPITLTEYAERSGKPAMTLKHRLHKAKKRMSTEEAANALAAKLLTHANETLPISEWAKRAGLVVGTFNNRLRHGWTMDAILSTPARECSAVVTYQGRTQTLGEWCNELDLPYNRTHHRIYVYGWSVEDAFTLPNGGRRKRR